MKVTTHQPIIAALILAFGYHVLPVIAQPVAAPAAAPVVAAPVAPVAPPNPPCNIWYERASISTRFIVVMVIGRVMHGLTRNSGPPHSWLSGVLPYLTAVTFFLCFPHVVPHDAANNRSKMTMRTRTPRQHHATTTNNNSGCSFCAPGFVMGNPAGVIPIPPEFAAQAPPGLTQVPCSLLDIAGTSGQVPANLCNDDLRLLPLFRTTW
jgi:hypothetical protein